MRWGGENGEASPAIHEVVERRGILVPMRDGVRLSLDLFLPVTRDPVPAILTMTPYDNNGTRAEAAWWAARGYAHVAADTRGRYDSEGDFDPFDPRHGTDGHDLVEWIAARPWATDRVGMIGASYGGWIQWWTAATAPPHLAAIAPLVGQPDHFEYIPYQHGVIAAWFSDWAASMSGRTMQATERFWYPADERTPPSPFVGINRERGFESAPWFEEWYRRNLDTDPYWRAIAYQTPEAFGRIRVPALCITGWFDAAHPGSPLNFRGLRDHGSETARRPHLVIGPWNHATGQPVPGYDFGADANVDVVGLLLRWFDHHLKGIGPGFEDEDPVRVFVLGADRWRSAADWPLPETTFTPLYLASGSRANSSAGDGELVDVPVRDGADTYVYDPRTPTADHYDDDREHGGIMTGPVDTRRSAAGAEVLVYRTPPLSHALEVVGPVEAVLHATTSARDTDWFVRLVDVHPDGTSLLLADGALRARSSDPRDGRFTASRLFEVVPGEVRRYTIRFWRGIGNVFLPGHRIGIEISSSWYPYYFPNFNTGADNLALVGFADAVPATQTILHGPRHPSYVLLPVIPAGS